MGRGATQREARKASTASITHCIRLAPVRQKERPGCATLAGVASPALNPRGKVVAEVLPSTCCALE